jgi:hypothetical protein
MVDDPSESSWMQTTALNRGGGRVNADDWREGARVSAVAGHGSAVFESLLLFNLYLTYCTSLSHSQ